MVLVINNGSYFAADADTTWLNGMECGHPFTAPEVPCYNGERETFVKTLKTANDYIDTFTRKRSRNLSTEYKKMLNSINVIKKIPRSNMRYLESAEVTYYRKSGPRPLTGNVLKNFGKSMVRILSINDLNTQNRHFRQ
ncbi:unnamed protein product [Schistosoma mattheei]|uniref:Integrase catalytic domain-containing protein n=1 Tax=Schistosoma mattheei TaxID=31246 RepID=A0AA85BS39_9TREM|nr:unnamed protein product [Schistosoma mattheei]